MITLTNINFDNVVADYEFEKASKVREEDYEKVAFLCCKNKDKILDRIAEAVLKIKYFSYIVFLGGETSRKTGTLDEYLEYLKHPEKKIEKIPMEDDIKEIKNLLNTLTSSLELKKMKDSELSLDMLNELKDTSTIDTEDPLIKNLISGASKIEENKNKEEDIDNTFNTTSMNIKVKDYGDDEPKKKNPVLSILVGLLIISVIALGVFILYKVVA